MQRGQAFVSSGPHAGVEAKGCKSSIILLENGVAVEQSSPYRLFSFRVRYRTSRSHDTATITLDTLVVNHYLRHMIINNKTRKLIRLNGAAERLDLQPSTLRDWFLKRKNLDFVKAGRAVCVTEESLERFIDANTILAREARG